MSRARLRKTARQHKSPPPMELSNRTWTTAKPQRTTRPVDHYYSSGASPLMGHRTTEGFGSEGKYSSGATTSYGADKGYGGYRDRQVGAFL